jgi:AcrR family transcriptional regulator
VTTKNLAQHQNVTEPALYRQFKGKQEILDNIIEAYVGYDEKIMSTIRQSNLSGKEAVLFYAKRFSELYQNYSELTTVMFSMDLYQYNPKTKTRMQEIIQTRLLFLESIFCSDSFPKEKKYSAKELASMVNGIIFAQTYEWRIMDKSYSLEERILSVIEKILFEI